MKKQIIVISCGPGLDEIKNEYGHSYQWVQDRCNTNDVIFSQSNAWEAKCSSHPINIARVKENKLVI